MLFFSFFPLSWCVSSTFYSRWIDGYIKRWDFFLMVYASFLGRVYILGQRYLRLESCIFPNPTNFYRSTRIRLLLIYFIECRVDLKCFEFRLISSLVFCSIRSDLIEEKLRARWQETSIYVIQNKFKKSSNSSLNCWNCRKK